MSNPPAGWYPDPTGQPDTIRWWNGKQWTNRTDKAVLPGEDEPTAPDPAEDAVPDTSDAAGSPEPEPVQAGPQVVAAWSQEGAGSGWGTSAPQAGWDTTSPPQQGGWWPTPDESENEGGRRLSAVGSVDAGVASDDGLTPFERARATWNAPEIAPAPPEHWTQRPVPDTTLEVASSPDEGQAAPNGWTLRLATTPDEDGTAAAASGGAGAGAAAPEAVGAPEGAGTATAEPEVGSWGAAAGGDWGVEGETGVQAGVSAASEDGGASAGGWGVEPESGAPTATPTSWEAPAGMVPPTDGSEPGWSDVSWTQAPNAARKPRSSADDTAAETPDNETTQVQSTWSVDPDLEQTPTQQTWGVAATEAQPENTQPSEAPGQQPAANAWGIQPDDAQTAGTSWGTQETTPNTAQPAANTWGTQADGAQGAGASWGAQETTPDTAQPAANAWGAQADGVQSADQQPAANTWGSQADGAQTAGTSWGGQADGAQGAGTSWGAQETTPETPQPAANAWGAQADGVQAAGTSWGTTPDAGQQPAADAWGAQGDGVQGAGSSWGAGQGGDGPWGGQQEASWGAAGAEAAPVAWGEQKVAWGEEQQAGGWGAGPALAGDGGKPKAGGRGGTAKKKPSGGGGGPSGAKLPLLIGGGIALVMLIVAAVFLITNSGDKKAGPEPTTPASQPTLQPTSTSKPGQSKNPKLHEGERIASTAISFPRRTGPWSDRKRLVPELLDSSGQYVLLQEKFDGTNDWYANIFVGALGNQAGFGGDPKATALALADEVPASLYGGIPITRKPGMNGAVKRSDRSGWYVQQTITAKSPKVKDRVLTLTVAVFDLGDGTAVAYISDIPTTRPDLKAAESLAYKGITVG
ncbi:DUF2510 domain-containing protein [Kribbella sp. NPDC020789]